MVAFFVCNPHITREKMNYRELDDTWKKFAAYLGGDLYVTEKPHLHGVKVDYQIEFTNELSRITYYSVKYVCL